MTNSIEEPSPDLSDLYKRFENINPPDLIAQTRPSTAQEILANVSETKDKDNENDEIELPEHLQKMVDSAMAQIEQEENENPD